MTPDLELQSARLTHKIKHWIIASGHTLQSAAPEEFYQAFCASLREEIMVHWTATLNTFEKKKVKTVYLLSMEYLPGRFLNQNIINLGAMELVQRVLKNFGKNLSDLLVFEADPGLGNGGLGRLASCFLDSLATLHYPARAYGLRYQYGIFEQEIWNGMQVERPDCWLHHTNPWEMRHDLLAVNVHFRGRMVSETDSQGNEISLLEEGEEVRALPYDIPIVGYSETSLPSVLTLRLWSTKESPRNFQLQRYNAGLLDQATENTCLTDVLYPNDNMELGKRVRLKQEFLLVSASLQDIIRDHLHVFGTMASLGDKVRIQINDTHPALVIVELVRILTQHYSFSWEQAWDVCQSCCSYTNHTILGEGLEEWNEHRVQELLPRQYRIIQQLNLQFCNQVRTQFPDDEERVRRLSFIEKGQIRMAHLAIYGSHKVNGVSELHTDILRNKLFKDFSDFAPEKFINITNGVTQRRWLLHANPWLAEFLIERIGKGWISDFSQVSKLAPFAKERASQEAFWHVKQKNKERLLKFLKTVHVIRDKEGRGVTHDGYLGTSALFDVQIKRIHEYKRQLMSALHLIMLYQEWKAGGTGTPRFAIFAGKAAPGYLRAKQILELICAIARKVRADSDMRGKLGIVVMENYNVSRAEIIIPAADLSEQISTAGWEASGTGNMKLAINGALTIGTEDGANIEMRKAVTDAWWPFPFGKTAEENASPYNPLDVYRHDEAIRRAVDALKSGEFVEKASEQVAFSHLHQSLLQHDLYRVLQDLRAFYEAQKKVEALFQDPYRWAEVALHNIAAMGRFSADVSIHNYAQKIWGIVPCPLDPAIMAAVEEEDTET